MAAFPSHARGTAAGSPAAHSETTQPHAKRKNKQFSSADLEDVTHCFTLWKFHREPLAWPSCIEPSKMPLETAAGVRTPPAYINLNDQK